MDEESSESEAEDMEAADSDKGTGGDSMDEESSESASSGGKRLNFRFFSTPDIGGKIG